MDTSSLLGHRLGLWHSGLYENKMAVLFGTCIKRSMPDKQFASYKRGLGKGSERCRLTPNSDAER